MEEASGVTCCSTGNHGRGVAYAARARGIRAVICMSELVPQAKVDGIRALGAEVRIAGRSQDDARREPPIDGSVVAATCLGDRN